MGILTIAMSVHNNTLDDLPIFGRRVSSIPGTYVIVIVMSFVRLLLIEFFIKPCVLAILVQ